MSLPTSGRTTRFAGKGALVTGAAQGIGREVAMQLAREGAHVIVADADETHAQAVVSEIKGAGGRAHAIIVDLETAAGANYLVAQAIEVLGAIDVAIHNVGGTIWSKPFWEYEEHEIEKEISRSLWPTLWGCRAVIPHMRERHGGAIVNIGSVAVHSIYRVPYAAAKAGVHAITECMALELEDCGVRVNCVAPGGIDAGPRAIPRNPGPLSVQEMDWKRHMTVQTIANTPLRRYGRVEEVAAAVCFLAADEASYITGQVLYVAGGDRG
jgi:dihydroxycyclohexadiene carboxylate dehydrogenase